VLASGQVQIAGDRARWAPRGPDALHAVRYPRLQGVGVTGWSH